MPNIQSAKKAIRVSLRKRAVNDSRRVAMKSKIKEIAKVAQTGSSENIQQALREAYQAIDKALKRGVIKKNTASRKKSKVAKMIAKSA